MKRIFFLLTSANLAFGQTTVVTCFEDAPALPNIGIVAVADYEKVTAEVDRLRKELDQALRGKAAAVRKGELALQQRESVKALQTKMRKARQEMATTMQRSHSQFTQREKAMVAKVNAMEKERAQVTANFQKKIATLQADFGKQKSEWERRLMTLEDERDAAVRKLEESELIRVRDHEAWKKSVADYQKEAAKAMRTAQMKSTQVAVANTARLAEEWRTERQALEAQIAKSEQALAQQTAAWEKAVAEWRKKAEKAVRTAQIENAQEAVANTAKLATEWQSERAVLESEVKKLTHQLAQLEGRLNVKGFEDKQTEVLRSNLSQKSKALTTLGQDAARLAEQWTAEREESRRELEAARALYRSTTKEVKTRDQRLRQLENSLADKNAALAKLATEAEGLSSSWKVEKGGLRKQIATLEKKLAACEKQLAANEKQLAASRKKQSAQANQSQESAQKLSEHIAIVSDLRKKLGQAKTREESLKTAFLTLKNQVADLKAEMTSYQSQKEADAQALAALKAELKQAQSNYTAAEKDLAQAGQNLATARQQVTTLRTKSQTLAKDLVQAQQELAKARQQAEANKQAKQKADKKEAQVKNLEGQLGRLAVAQQELEGTLISTLGDFEKLQESYLKLQADSADGGEAARKAMAERDQAQDQLKALQKRLKAQEGEVKQVKQRVQAAEEKRKAVEADAAAGKAALGKREAELQLARRELGQLQLGQEVLLKEAKALRERFVSIQPVRYQLASANVVAQQQRVLAEVRQVLEVYPQANFSIKGHTCNIGSEEANLNLSEDRAEGLRDFLIANGVEAERFTLVIGCGDTEPEANNETEEGRRQNRRVEIKVLK